jgi:hypothetical protein
VTSKKLRHKAWVFDIETIADPKMAKLLPPVKAAGNLRDPEKIKMILRKKKRNAEMKWVCTLCRTWVAVW